MQHSHPTLVLEPLIPHLPILYLLPLPPLTIVSCSWLFFYTSCLLSPLILSGFFNGMLGVFEPGALNCCTFFCPIPFTLSVSRNPILTPLPLGFLDSLLCVLIALTPSLAFSLMMPRTLVAASSFLSGKAYPFLNYFLSFFA